MTTSAADRLRAAGLRATRPRTAVLEALDAVLDVHGHLTAAEVADAARERVGAVSVQAVYDCLDALTHAGLARRIEPAGLPALYEARVGDAHHHVVCRSCGRIADVDAVEGEVTCLALPGGSSGFVVDEAEVTFWGLCPACVGAG